MPITSRDNPHGSMGESGFTLLEVLVALVLLVILSGAVYGTYFSIMNSRERVTERLEPLRDVRATLDMLRREISGAYFTQENKRLHFLVEDRDNFGKPSSTLDFTTVGMPGTGSAPTTDLVSVRYETKEKSGNLLVTRQENNMYFDQEPRRYPQIEKLEGFLVECYDGNRWVRSWDTKLNTGLPKAVRVTITIREGEKNADFSMIAKPRIGNLNT